MRGGESPTPIIHLDPWTGRTADKVLGFARALSSKPITLSAMWPVGGLRWLIGIELSTPVIPGIAKREPGIHCSASRRPDGFRLALCAPRNDG